MRSAVFCTLDDSVCRGNGLCDKPLSPRPRRLSSDFDRLYSDGMKPTRKRAARRDRRKAKQSDFAREGTVNPRKKGHHAYEARHGGEGETGAGAAEGARLRCEEAGGHDFRPDPGRAIKRCRCCGALARMAAEEFRPEPGGRLVVPESIRKAAAKPPLPAAELNSPPPQEVCRGPHDWRRDADLGIRACRRCGTIDK